jgi:RecB family exonuclease
VSELTVISGRPVELTEALAGRIGELRVVDPLSPISVLVGTSLQRPWLERWLAARLGAHANVRILMPGDLALLLGAPALVDAGRRALPPLADRVLLVQVARSQEGYFEPVREMPGFGEALYRLVRELKGAGYELSDLGPGLEGATDAPDKAGSLADLLAAFEARRREFYGPDDALLTAEPGRLGGLGLLVYGMLDLQPALERLLVAIAERMPVEVFAPQVPAAEDAPLAQALERLIGSGATLVSAPGHVGQVRALERVRESLFTPLTGTQIESDETLRLVSAPDPSREVRAAARACLQWAREGRRFWQMAVAYRHGDAYRPLVESVFIEAGIPVYLHEGSPLAERPVGRQTLALLDLYETDLSRQSVMDFMTDARFPKELREEYGGIPAARWDSVSRQAGIIGGADQWSTRLSALQHDLRGDGDEPAWVTERIADVARLERFIVDLHRRLLSHPGRAPWSEHLDHLQALLGRYVNGGGQVIDALRGLERFTALDNEVEHATFLDVVRRAIENLRAEDVLQGQPGAFARRGVNVLAVNSLVGISFECVWILGATERAFPPPARQDPILLDPERQAISERTGLRLAARGARGSEEALQFTLACEAAGERLVVSYARRATGENRPRLPSIFFREIASQLEGRRVSAEEAPILRRADVERIAGDAIGAPVPGGRYAKDPEVVARAAESAVSVTERDRTFLQARVTAPAAIAVFERAEPAFARARLASRERRSGRYSEWDGALDGAAVQAITDLVPADRVFSPTSLETYAKCPQQFLLGDVLRVRGVEEPERTVRIDDIRRGNLFHRIFQRFHSEWQGSGVASVAPDAELRMRTIAEEECAAAAARGETGYPAMWAADQIEVIEDCLRWLAIERDDPTIRQLPLGACEARFGRRNPGEQSGTLSRDEPIEIDIGALTLRLAGRIDRITWDAEPPTRFRVIDYKTGQVREEKPAQLQGGRALQLPLYAFAGGELLGLDPAAGEVAYVYPTRRGHFRVVPWSSEQLADRRADVIALLAAVLEGIRRGDFMIAPWKDDGRTACRYCNFNEICPGAHRGYATRKAEDPRRDHLDDVIRSVE